LKRFQFQLDPVLRARAIAERQAQREVAAIESRRARVRDLIAEHQENLTQGRAALRAAIVGRVDLVAVRSHAGAVRSVMRRADEVVLQLAALEREFDGARRQLIEASRARRTIEILRQHREREWRIDAARHEQRILDDLMAACTRRGEYVT